MSRDFDWDDVHARAHRQLRATAARLVSPDDADDVTQDTFLKALQSAQSFRSESALTTWLHAILVNRCIDLQRRRRRRGVHVGLEEWRDGGYSRNPVGGFAVRQVWPTLTRRHRAVLFLHDVAGFTHAEIGGRLGICAGSSKSALFNARRRMRSRLSSDPPT